MNPSASSTLTLTGRRRRSSGLVVADRSIATQRVYDPKTSAGIVSLATPTDHLHYAHRCSQQYFKTDQAPSRHRASGAAGKPLFVSFMSRSKAWRDVHGLAENDEIKHAADFPTRSTDPPVPGSRHLEVRDVEIDLGMRTSQPCCEVWGSVESMTEVLSDAPVDVERRVRVREVESREHAPEQLSKVKVPVLLPIDADFVRKEDGSGRKDGREGRKFPGELGHEEAHLGESSIAQDARSELALLEGRRRRGEIQSVLAECLDQIRLIKVRWGKESREIRVGQRATVSLGGGEGGAEGEGGGGRGVHVLGEQLDPAGAKEDVGGVERVGFGDEEFKCGDWVCHARLVRQPHELERPPRPFRSTRIHDRLAEPHREGGELIVPGCTLRSRGELDPSLDFEQVSEGSKPARFLQSVPPRRKRCARTRLASS